MYYFIYYDKNNIINEHYHFHSFCFFFGYLLNIIPAWISHAKSKEKEKENLITNESEEESIRSIEYIYNKPYEKYLSTRDILKFLFICLILLLTDIIENIGIIIEDNEKKEKENENEKKEEKYNDDYFFIEYLIIFIATKFDKEVYYKHQYISFLVLILVGAIKIFYFLMKELYQRTNFIAIVLNIIYSIFYAIYYIYIKGLMKYKFISPYKYNFMIGVINTPIIILMYFVISFTTLGKEEINNIYYYDNIFKLFNDLGKIDVKNAILIILAPFVFGIYAFIVIKIIYDYSIFHIYIPVIMQYFIENIVKNFAPIDNIFLISSFFIELIMILVFLEIIEIKFCGLNENLKRNIELRGIKDSSLDNEDDDEDKINDEANDENNKIIY